mmetsp:Transcript_29880/g.65766  ORF Transcript_29880/g.65766 Transcript_29880/m.65766 type:complete len:118 (-) Transcript_29880:813-1166(-)
MFRRDNGRTPSNPSTPAGAPQTKRFDEKLRLSRSSDIYVRPAGSPEISLFIQLIGQGKSHGQPAEKGLVHVRNVNVPVTPLAGQVQVYLYFFDRFCKVPEAILSTRALPTEKTFGFP